MIITIDNKKNKLVNIEGFRFKKYYFNRYKAYFFGNFRTPLDVIEKIILSDSKVFLDNKVFKLFKHIHGDMTLVISDDNEVKIFSSIYNSTLKIFKNENNFHITNNEFFEKKKKLSENLSFLKLFSHHSFFIPQGLSENCYDFMLPGSILTFRRNNIGHYDLSWYLKFEEFCSRDDHDQIVRDLSESFQDQFNFKHDKLKTKIALSGGLDSATVLAATKSYQDISAFTYAKLFDPQLWTAKNVVKKLNKKLQIKYFYSGPYSDITFKTDIRDLLNFSYRYISKDSVPFFLNNSTDRKSVV